MNTTIPPEWTEPTPMNGSNQSSYPFCDNTEVLDYLIFIIAPVGLAGNMTVLWLLGFCIRRNAISVYILNLALSDFLFLCCLIISSLLDIIKLFNHLSVSIILSNLAFLPYIAGLSILSAISTERCLSVLWPIWYRCHRPRHMSPVMCAVLWSLSLMLIIPEWYYSGFVDPFFHGDWWKYVDFIISAWLIILFVILSESSLALLLRILCGSRRMPLTRLYVTILLTVLVFLICGLPFGIHWFLLCWLPIPFYTFCYLHPMTVALCCVNSCANPIIYFFIGSFRQRRQQRTLKLLLQRALQDTPEE
jgi:Mas-related G protein-coupled receptor protein X